MNTAQKIIILYGSTSQGINPPPIPDPDQAVLYYVDDIRPRDEWTQDGKQLTDYSNSNNGGVIHSGGALGFDGVNDEVDIGSLGNIRTFSLWVATLFDSEPILDLNGSVHLNTSNGTLNVSGSVPHTIYVNGVPSTTLVTGEFQYVTVVFDQDVPVILGRLGGFGGTNGVFEASELLFYSKGLSSAEVLSNYNNPQSPLKSGLVAWWDFNELSGATLFDRSGNGYNASILGGTWINGISVGYQPALGGFNNYDVFDGSTNYVEIPSAVVSVGDDFVMNFEFMFGAVSVSTQGIAGGLTAASNRWAVQIAPDETLRVGTYNGSWVSSARSTITFVPNVKYTCTWTNASGVSTLEINGVDVTQAGTPSVTPDFVGGITSLGRANNTGNYFNGIIDYVEVEGVGRWSNLGGWVDEIGTNDGTPNGTFEKARIAGEAYNSKTDVLGNTILNPFKPAALNFSGGFSGCYVDAGSAVDTSGAFSFAGWIKYTESGINIFSNSGLGTGCGAYITGSGQVIRFRNNDGSNTDVDTPAIYSQDWAFICLTRSSDGTKTNWFIGDKTTPPTNQTVGGANRNSGTPTAGSENLYFAARAGDALFPADGYLSSQIMYTEDLSAANTDLTKIEEIWNNTKNLI